MAALEVIFKEGKTPVLPANRKGRVLMARSWSRSASQILLPSEISLFSL